MIGGKPPASFLREHTGADVNGGTGQVMKDD